MSVAPVTTELARLGPLLPPVATFLPISASSKGSVAVAGAWKPTCVDDDDEEEEAEEGEPWIPPTDAK
jgi:hypothetical protein